MSENSSKKAPLSLDARLLRGAVVLLWAFASFAVSWVVVYSLQHFLVALGVPLAAINQNLYTMILATVTYSLTLLVAIGVPWYFKGHKTSLDDLGLSRLLTWIEIPLSLAGFIVYAILSSLLLYLAVTYIPGFDGGETQNIGFTSLGSRYEYLLAFVTLVILAPVAEEVIFRGYLYGNLRKYAPFWLSAVIVSGLFGLVHGQWNVAIDTFALSLILCSLREISGSLWPSILLHMIKNSVAFYLVFINPSLLTTMGG